MRGAGEGNRVTRVEFSSVFGIIDCRSRFTVTLWPLFARMNTKVLLWGEEATKQREDAKLRPDAVQAEPTTSASSAADTRYFPCGLPYFSRNVDHVRGVTACLPSAVQNL